MPSNSMGASIGHSLLDYMVGTGGGGGDCPAGNCDDCEEGLDLLFIFDISSSMNDEIAAAVAGADDLVSAIDNATGGEDYRIALTVCDETTPGNDPSYVLGNTTSTASTSGSSTTLTLDTANSDIVVGMMIQTEGDSDIPGDYNSSTTIATPTYVSSVSTTTVIMSQAHDVSSQTVRFYGTYDGLPSNQKITLNPGGTGSDNRVSDEDVYIHALEVFHDNNLDTFKSQLTKLDTTRHPMGHGMGGPETTDITFRAHLDDDFAGEMRDGIAKYVIIVTDVTPGGVDDAFDAVSTEDTDEMAALSVICQAEGIKVFVCGSQHQVWLDITAETGGFTTASVDSSTLANVITLGCGE